MSWLHDLIQTVTHELGISDRRQAERDWRQNAAAAQPGEVWTKTVITRDSRRRRALSWVSGPVESIPSRNGAIKMLGEEYLPDQATRLGPGIGVLPAPTRFHLQPGAAFLPP